jgi:hypothetical protein
MTRRAYYWPILIIGILMVVMPFAISMPSKTSAGQAMLNDFHPMMQKASVKVTVGLYKSTFEPLLPVAQGGIAAAGETTQMMTGFATALHMTPTQMSTYLGSKYPALAQLLASFPQMVPIFKNVGPGLNHYKPLVNTMQANVTNYAKVDSLPNFNLFTWFFAIPGVLISLFALLGLGLFGRKNETSGA